MHGINATGGPVGKPPNFRPDLVIHNPKDPEKIQKLMRFQSYIQLSLVPYHLYPMILEPYLQGRYIGYMEDAKKSPANGREYSYVDVLIAFVKGSQLEVANANAQVELFNILPVPGQTVSDFIDAIQGKYRQLKQYNNVFVSVRAHVFTHCHKYFI